MKSHELFVAYEASKKIKSIHWDRNCYITKNDENSVRWQNGRSQPNTVFINAFRLQPETWTVINESPKIKWII